MNSKIIIFILCLLHVVSPTKAQVEPSPSSRIYSENIAGLRDPAWLQTQLFQYRHRWPQEGATSLSGLIHLEYQDFWKAGQAGQWVAGFGFEVKNENIKGLLLQAQIQSAQILVSPAPNPVWRSKIGFIGNWYQELAGLSADEYFEVFHFHSALDSVGGVALARVYKRWWLRPLVWAIDPWALELRKNFGNQRETFGENSTSLSVGPRIYWQRTPSFYVQAQLNYGLRQADLTPGVQNFVWGAVLGGFEW